MIVKWPKNNGVVNPSQNYFFTSTYTFSTTFLQLSYRFIVNKCKAVMKLPKYLIAEKISTFLPVIFYFEEFPRLNSSPKTLFLIYYESICLLDFVFSIIFSHAY